MKHYLLTLPIVCFSATVAMAQTSVGDAIEAHEGVNSSAVTGDASATGYWKFTPGDDCLATISPLSGSANDPIVGTLVAGAADSEQPISAMTGARITLTDSNQSTTYANVYPLKKGTTYYISSTNVKEVGFNLSLQHNANIGGGLNYDDPAPVVVGENTYLGNPTSTSYNNYSAYASYKATRMHSLCCRRVPT